MSDTRPTPLQVASKLTARARSRGVGEVLRLGLDRVSEELASDDELVFLARSTAGEASERSDLVLRVASDADASAYAAAIGTDSPGTFTGRLSETTRCFVVFSDRRIVHATWMTIATAWTRELRAYLRPPRGDAYVYESFTHPAARGRGVYPFALDHIAAWLAGAGTEQVWVAVEADNPASLRAVGKAGFEERFRLAYRRRLGRLTIAAPSGPAPEFAAGWLSKRPRPRS